MKAARLRGELSTIDTSELGRDPIGFMQGAGHGQRGAPIMEGET